MEGRASDGARPSLPAMTLRTAGHTRNIREAPTSTERMILHPAAWLVLFIIAAVVVWFTMQAD